MSDSPQRTVAITGATRGLGAAAAREFAALGWRVAGCGRSSDLVAAMREELGAPHVFMEADVLDPAAMERFAAAAGPTDLLLNNAAVINQTAPLWEISPAEFGRVIDVNLKGVHHAVLAFVPAMIERGSGIIINFSSGWGRSTSPEVGPYCAAKWGVEGYTSSLAQELPRGLAAAALNPGVIDTEMLRACWGAEAAGYVTPAEWAKRAVPFLAGLDASCSGKQLTAP